MRNIQLFESYTNSNSSKYKDSEWWIKYLYPEEVLYLILYSDYDPKNPIIKIEEIDKVDWNLEEFDDDQGRTDFSIALETKMSGESVGAFIEGNFRGYFTPYISGGYMDPPEGGDPIVEDYEIDWIQYLDENIEDIEIWIEDEKPVKYEFKSDIVNLDMIKKLCYCIVEDNIMYNNEITFKYIRDKIEFPHELTEKIDNIRKDRRKEIFILNR